MTSRRYYRVAVNLPHIGEPFDYHLTDEQSGLELERGALVLVPFGAQIVQGVVFAEVEKPAVETTREIRQVLFARTLLPPHLLQLAIRLSEETLAPLGQWISLLLPAGIEQRSEWAYQWSGKEATTPLTISQQRVLRLLQKRGALHLRQIQKAMGNIGIQETLQALVRRGLVTSQPILSQATVRPKRVLTVSLNPDIQDWEGAFEKHKQRAGASYERRKKALQYVAQEGKEVEIPWVYAASGASLSDLKKLEEWGLVILNRQITWRDPLARLTKQEVTAVTLTVEQERCWQAIQEALHHAWSGQKRAPILLEGVTGSGKTELYLRAVEETLQAGKQAIVLVPEISLTPQTIRRFSARFPTQLGVYHSRLSAGERYDTWQRVWAGQISLVVGPRSSLFLPFSQPGLVVLDECHDDSYYQEQDPNYHAVQAAIAYMDITGGLCVLGSATPTIEQAYRAREGKWGWLQLKGRILAHQKTVESHLSASPLGEGLKKDGQEKDRHPLPAVRVVDMRAELKAGNRSIFSRLLCSKLEQVLENQQQAILYLNRRGTATYVFCRVCGAALKCPRCQIPLTYHLELRSPHLSKELICHRCNYQRGMPQRCPACGSQHIRQFGIGTERVEEEVRKLFPQARLLRWDADTTRAKGAHEEIWGRFADHQADVLIGTQMLAKGLDLPFVTLVGVVLADVGLNLPDYRAAERTFQLLMQVAGRAGRSALGGEVIFQTYLPDHYVIQSAARQDYEQFYQQELPLRQTTQYPPFSTLIRLEYRHTQEAKARQEAERMAAELTHWIDDSRLHSIRLIGPVPCFYQRLHSQFRWQIILAGDHPERLLRNRRWKNGWQIEINPISLL